MKRSQRIISLQLLVAITITFSILLLSVLLMYKSFSNNAKNIMAAAEVTAGHVTETVNMSVRFPIAPAQIALKLISHNPITTAKNLDERLSHLPVFVEVLNTSTLSRAIFIGYDNGEFFSLRRAQQENFPLFSSAPVGFHFFVQSRTLNKDKTFKDELLFYDQSLKLLERRIENGFNIDPRTRPWFSNAIESNTVEITKPYRFNSTTDIGLTISVLAPDKHAVLAIDVVTNDINELLASLRMTPKTEIVIIDEQQNIIAYHDMSRFAHLINQSSDIGDLASLHVSILNQIIAYSPTQKEITLFESEGTEWYGVITPLTNISNNKFKLLIAIPAHELFADVWSNFYNQAVIAAIIVFVMSVIGWFLGRRIVQPLQDLTKQVSSLSSFDFSKKIGVSTILKEVRGLGDILSNMATTIQSFMQTSRILNKEQNLELMLSLVLQELLGIVRLDQGAIYLFDEKTGILRQTVVQGEGYPTKLSLPFHALSDLELIQEMHTHIGSDEIVAALRNRENVLVGVLVILNKGLDDPIRRESFIQFVENISTSAAVAIETRQLIMAQKALLDAIIKLMADAIDAKSLYTGGHCRRVPEFALMIMEQVKNAKEPPFDQFSMTKAQEEEFRIAAWLHDCGKITTPEYVVDKASKLETINNRIHEIRMRFEVLHRDATIHCLSAIASGADPEQAQKTCREEHARLQEEFAFVGQCNIGSEGMDDQAIERLHHIAERTWLRYFDHMLGVSHDELKHMHYPHQPEILPVTEHLLADKEEHIIPWGEHIPPVQKNDPRNIWGFNMDLPEHMYNYGEIYNLSVKKGTLTTEERFKINEHIVQTICMLSTLPLPNSLSRIPDIAGNHHEKMDGTGYPHRTSARNMSVSERVLAVADVFEALTAVDRPYKEGKTLSQTLGMMSRMVKEQHLDPLVFNLVLRSGVYREYARAYLLPQQIDEVHIEELIVEIDEHGIAVNKQ